MERVLLTPARLGETRHAIDHEVPIVIASARYPVDELGPSLAPPRRVQAAGPDAVEPVMPDAADVHEDPAPGGLEVASGAQRDLDALPRGADQANRVLRRRVDIDLDRSA